MRKRLVAILVGIALAVPMVLAVPLAATAAIEPVAPSASTASAPEAGPATSTAQQGYSGPYYGADNFPPGCIRDMSPTNPQNICHHMRTGLNALDSPQVDVLIMIPASPTAERDMRIMRQSVEMWEGGIDYLASGMNLQWLADGVDFHITVDYFDPADDGGGEFTTYPVVDPEIVVIATNPVGGAGIGIDPVDAVFKNEDLVPCHNVQNPFDFEYWENLPGFDGHHDERAGTYVEDCGGAGGNICFAINGAIDPAPDRVDIFNLFDLVSHEFGHCLTLGHVGDGAEGKWGVVPTNDIMAYNNDPPERNKCVSTLDVEAFALRMSRYLDVNGDGRVDPADHLKANDQIGEGGNPFQVQHPKDHLYASGTGSPLQCPQPDLGVVPGARTRWQPTPVATTRPQLRVTSPADGSTSADGAIDVSGTVERVAIDGPPSATAGSYDDADDDATTPITEILDFAVETSPTHVTATIGLEELWPSTDVISPTSYSVIVNGRRFDSFVRYAIDSNPRTWDNGAGAYMPNGTSRWDLVAKTVTFEIPRDYLAKAAIVAPYHVSSRSAYGVLSTGTVDDRAPEFGTTVGVAAPPTPGNASMISMREVETDLRTEFDREGGNRFVPTDSSFGTTHDLGVDRSHRFELDVAQSANVRIELTWSDEVGATDLDLYVTGAADSGGAGASANPAEAVYFEDVQGQLDIQVDPYLVTGNPTTYALVAIVDRDTDGDGVHDSTDRCPDRTGTDPSGCPDSDGDGVADPDDVCLDEPGDGADGCPMAATERVHVYANGVLAGSQDVDTVAGQDTFSIPVQIPAGTHELTVDWEDRGAVIASSTVTVHRGPDPAHDPSAADADDDGRDRALDNCPERANADQADLDDDGRGDVCDPDIDGDGHSNAKERAHGTDPRDPADHPGRRRVR